MTRDTRTPPHPVAIDAKMVPALPTANAVIANNVNRTDLSIHKGYFFIKSRHSFLFRFCVLNQFIRFPLV